MPSNESAIHLEVLVSVEPDRAFAMFTAEMASWWPLATHSVAGEDAVSVTVDGRVGGEITEAARDGEHHVWGTIQEWEPPRLVTSWHPGGSPDDATELEIRFEPTGTGSRLVLEHRGWERPTWTPKRESYVVGWEPVLDDFARALEPSVSSA